MTEQESFEQSSQDKQFLVDGGKLKEKIDDLEEYRGMISADTVLDFIEYCRLPIQHPDRIEAAIRYFNSATAPLRTHETIDLLRYVLGQEQETWSDKDFGLEGK